MPCQDGFNDRDIPITRYEDSPETINRLISLTERNDYLAQHEKNIVLKLLTN